MDQPHYSHESAERGRAQRGRAAKAFEFDEEFDRHRVSERLLARGQRVFSQGQDLDCLYLVRRGWVALEHVLPDGQRQIVDFALPGAIIGHQLDADGHAPHSAECLSDCWLLLFNRSQFFELVQSDPRVDAAYRNMVLDDLERAHDQLSNVARRSGAGKIAHLIIKLMDRAAGAGGGVDETRLPLTQGQLAAALGITNVYVSRMVKSMRQDGLIAWRRGALEVLDPKRLRAMAAGA